MQIVITGNPVDGLVFHGPFADHEAATRFAEQNFRTVDWWVAPIERTER